MKKTLEDLKIKFAQDPFPSIKTRRARLAAVRNLLLEYCDSFCVAISEDFGCRSPHETKLTEIFPLLNQVKYLENHLPLWLQEEHRPVDLLFQSASAKVIHVPLGVVGIISPWNFPLLLSLSPLLSALVGGNLAMIKMSEFTPRTAMLLKEAIEKHLDGCVCVFPGDPATNPEFSSLSFDHLFFTGSPRVGSLVMQAAGKNLTPITLELGGKSPVIAAPDFNLRQLTEKLVWAKSLNAGQICIAPDYLICPEERMQSVLEQSKTQFSQLYPQGAFDSNFTSIITQEHFDRLLLWLEEARALGAQIVPISDNPLNKDQRKIAPHFIINPPQSAKVMKEEIFGPLLPVITYGDFTESKTQLKAYENPLALYLFTEDKNIKDEFQHSVSSGGLCINDMILHVSVDDLPFGGVRTSGIGQYHGIEGFLTFTRPKAIFQRGRFSFLGIAKPPYKSKLLPWIYRMMGIK